MRVQRAYREESTRRVVVETDVGRVLITANSCASPQDFPARSPLRPAWSGAWVQPHAEPDRAWILRPIQEGEGV